MNLLAKKFIHVKYQNVHVLRETNYLRKLGLHLDISPISSWFILILALNNE